MKNPVAVLLILAAGLGYLVHVDGTSPLALEVIKVQRMIGGVSLPALALVGAILLFGKGFFSRMGGTKGTKDSWGSPGVMRAQTTEKAPERLSFSDFQASQERERKQVVPQVEKQPSYADPQGFDDESGYDDPPLFENPSGFENPDTFITEAPLHEDPAPADGLFVSSHGDNWLEQSIKHARSLDQGIGASVKLAIGTPIPFVLVLVDVPSERAKQAVETFAGFLAGIPTPPQVRIHYRSCPGSPDDRFRSVAVSFQNAFDSSTYKTYRQGDSVAVVFKQPDARWEELSR